MSKSAFYILAILVVISLGINIYSFTQQTSGTITQTELSRDALQRAQRDYYLVGVLDGFAAANVNLPFFFKAKKLYCEPAGVTYTPEVLQKLIADEKRLPSFVELKPAYDAGNVPDNIVLLNALMARFPCNADGQAIETDPAAAVPQSTPTAPSPAPAQE